jgi:hypothetical protein
MHMARRAAAWAVWTCDIRHCRRNLQVPVTVKESGLRPALCFGHYFAGRVLSSKPNDPNTVSVWPWPIALTAAHRSMSACANCNLRFD